MNPYRQYEQYATEKQKQYLDAIDEHGSMHAASAALGLSRNAVSSSLANLKKRAIARGLSPEEDASGRAPEGYHIKGKSTYYDKDGKVRAQWVKTNKDAQTLEELANAIVEGLDVPAALPVPAPKAPEVTGFITDQLAVYPIGDAHIGSLAWAPETGEDHDIRIASEELTRVAAQLVSLAPPTEECEVIDVGDFFHADNYKGITERGGNVLDCDSRYLKMVRAGKSVMISIITAALHKHRVVNVRCAGGNHDTQTSKLFAMILEAHYRDEPRVVVHATAKPFQYRQFGRCLIGVTHGDKCKPQALAEIMATDKPVQWGATDYRYWYTGHVHHDQRKEFRGCMFESFRTLARKDAWHNEAGYRSGRDMKCIVLHATRGEILRHTVGLL